MFDWLIRTSAAARGIARRAGDLRGRRGYLRTYFGHQRLRLVAQDITGLSRRELSGFKDGNLGGTIIRHLTKPAVRKTPT